MKAMNGLRPWRMVRGMMALAGVLLLAGCLDERIVWSPDGNRAAVIAKDGLRLCDAGGNLTPLLLPNVSIAAWLADSRQLVVGTRREVDAWADIARALGPEQAAPIEAEAESLWRGLESGGTWSVISMDLKEDKAAVRICLRDLHADGLRAKLSKEEWRTLETAKAQINELMPVRLEGDRVVTGAVLRAGLGTIWSIRPAADGKVIAFTQEMKPGSDALALFVTALDGSQGVVEVAKFVSAYPDWTPDGRSVVYFGSAGAGAKDEEIQLGALTRREVRDAGGRIQVAPKPDFLAGVLLNGFGRVRCLRDGRILFNTAELNLPFAAEDYDNPREQLFALEPGRQPNLVRLIPHKREADLPTQLAFFEVSPDEHQVLFGSTKGEVCLLTLATGEVEQIQSAERDSPPCAPVWRMAGELTYVKRAAGKDGPAGAHRAAIVQRKGKEEVVLSRAWPEDVVKGVTE